MAIVQSSAGIELRETNSTDDRLANTLTVLDDTQTYVALDQCCNQV